MWKGGAYSHRLFRASCFSGSPMSRTFDATKRTLPFAAAIAVAGMSADAARQQTSANAYDFFAISSTFNESFSLVLNTQVNQTRQRQLVRSAATRNQGALPRATAARMSPPIAKEAKPSNVMCLLARGTTSWAKR